MYRTDGALRGRAGFVAAVALTVAVAAPVPADATVQPADVVTTSHQVVTGGLMPVGARSSGGAVAVCPRGTRAVAGGWQTNVRDGVAAMWSHPVPGSGGAADMWTVGIENTGAATVNLTPYAVCMGGLTAIDVDRGDFTRPPGEEAEAAEYCATGKQGFGTGVRTSSGGRVISLDVHEHHWGIKRGAGVRNDAAAAVDHVRYSICGVGLESAEHHASPAVEVPVGAVVPIAADCPTGRVILGGGGVPDHLRGDIVNSYPESATRWVNQVRNSGDDIGRFLTKIACGNTASR